MAPLSAEHKAKISAARSGHRQTPEDRAKRAAGLKRAYAEGRRARPIGSANPAFIDGDHDTRKKLKRRGLDAASFVAPVDRLAIFERDGYVCQLCFEPTNRAAGPHDRDAPTLDHILPVTRGGTHEPSNVQCAHRSCNSRKGNRVTG